MSHYRVMQIIEPLLTDNLCGPIRVDDQDDLYYTLPSNIVEAFRC